MLSRSVSDQDKSEGVKVKTAPINKTAVTPGGENNRKQKSDTPTRSAASRKGGGEATEKGGGK
ncbi:MAG: hypothetical protein RPU34_13570 [Candidatus Sedimenticola sp. (ex Thyasira tokunagai)]